MSTGHEASQRRCPSEPKRGKTARVNGSAVPDPWGLIWGQPYIDSATLARAITNDLGQNPDPDFRTRLLVRDALKALRAFWGTKKFSQWLAASPVGDRLQSILQENLGEVGFPYIRRRLVAAPDQTQVEQIFDLLGRNIPNRVEVYVAGSIPTLIQGLTARPTADIIILNEVPVEIRRQRKVLAKIQADYGLQLGHIQSHYLPARWEQRRRFLGDFGGLRVYLMDVYDVFVSKLSSKQEKHQQDVRVLAQKLDQDKAKHLLLGDGKAFLDDPLQRPQIEKNWQFIYQEPLVPQPPDETAPSPKRKKGHKKES
jgi:hypothetical protein